MLEGQEWTTFQAESMGKDSGTEDHLGLKALYGRQGTVSEGSDWKVGAGVGW
jgi:hypothetical protein